MKYPFYLLPVFGFFSHLHASHPLESADADLQTGNEGIVEDEKEKPHRTTLRIALRHVGSYIGSFVIFCYLLGWKKNEIISEPTATLFILLMLARLVTLFLYMRGHYWVERAVYKCGINILQTFTGFVIALGKSDWKELPKAILNAIYPLSVFCVSSLVIDALVWSVDRFGISYYIPYDVEEEGEEVIQQKADPKKSPTFDF